jgi:hypothetical protein
MPALRACTYWHQSRTIARPPPTSGRQRLSGGSAATPIATKNAACAIPSFTHFMSVSARALALISVVCGELLVAEMTS